MGYLKTGYKNECYGCTACAEICPNNAISMQADVEGFLYPDINSELCVNCDLCKKVCSAEKYVKKTKPQKSVATIYNDDVVLLKSSSGGAFKALLESVDCDTIVYGVCWESRSIAVFDKANVDDAFEKFRKSKYIQAEIRNTYFSVKNDLDNGGKVLFVGTPCQVSGLKEFLRKPYDNLLLVDLICHGVPSSKVLEKQFEAWDSKYDKVKSIQFRYKEQRNNKWNSKYALVEFESGKTKRFEYDTSAFLRGYDNGLFFRPSCSTCQFATINRVSDITIGDYWGSKEYDVHKGLSLVFANTEKGLNSVDKMSDTSTIIAVNLDYAVANNARLRNPDKGHKNRQDFFDNLDRENFDKIVQKYVPKVPNLKKFAHKIISGIGG